MKNIYLTLGLGALMLGATAQQKIEKKITAIQPANYDASALTALTQSTLTPSTMQTGGCAVTTTGNIVYYSVAQNTATANYTLNVVGYMFGTNSYTYTNATASQVYSENKAAQKYSVNGSGTVNGLIVIAAKAHSMGSSVVTAKIYSENATTKAPSAQIGTSGTLALNAFTGGGQGNYIPFSTPVPVSAGKFFAVVESPAIGGAGMDTLCIMSTKMGCSSTDSLAWYYTSVSTSGFWGSVNDGYGDNLDILIFPVVDIAAGVNNSISKGELTLTAAYPNPANNEVSVNFMLAQDSKVDVEVYDVAGKLINSVALNSLQAGAHTTKINTENLTSGVYMYSVKSNNAKLFSRFTISK